MSFDVLDCGNLEPLDGLSGLDAEQARAFAVQCAAMARHLMPLSAILVLDDLERAIRAGSALPDRAAIDAAIDKIKADCSHRSKLGILTTNARLFEESSLLAAAAVQCALRKDAHEAAQCAAMYAARAVSRRAFVLALFAHERVSRGCLRGSDLEQQSADLRKQQVERETLERARASQVAMLVKLSKERQAA